MYNLKTGNEYMDETSLTNSLRIWQLTGEYVTVWCFLSAVFKNPRPTPSRHAISRTQAQRPVCEAKYQRLSLQFFETKSAAGS